MTPPSLKSATVEYIDAFGFEDHRILGDLALIYSKPHPGIRSDCYFWTDKLEADANLSKPVFLHPKICEPLDPERDPSKNSTPRCASPTVGANSRGIVTADVLV